MYLKIKRIEKKPTTYGNDLVIKMIALYNDDHQFMKNVKLNDDLIESITDGKIIFDIKKAMK